METRLERIKKKSDHLRGDIAEQLADESRHAFSNKNKELLKAHGIYQQQDRDQELTDENHMLMIRSRIPGGRMTAEQWLGYDKLAEAHGRGSLRLTTRQTIQNHWIQKGTLKEVMQGIDALDLTTIGGCGDVVRNVTQACNPLGDPDLSLLDSVAQTLSDRYKWRSRAYPEIWLDGEKLKQEDVEPIYGTQYMPRKFKVGLTLVGQNEIDLLSNDLGIAATVAEGAITGFHIFVGGGMGRSHNNPATYPAVAQHLGYISPEALEPVCDAVITLQRDHGDRTDRLHARLKYLVTERGIEWFREQVAERSGVQPDPTVAVPEWKIPKYLGWQQRLDGSWAFGVHILAGRIVDRPEHQLRSALREVLSHLGCSLQITADQDLILLGIQEEQKADVERIFAEHQVDPASPDPVYDRALACVAMPTCPLAITESERVLPQILAWLNQALGKYGLDQEAPLFRMTGCPNGCARPYGAELALVGQTQDSYQVWVGGCQENTRLAKHLCDTVPFDRLEELFDAMVKQWSEQRTSGQSFGDYSLDADWSDVVRLFGKGGPAGDGADDASS